MALRWKEATINQKQQQQRARYRTCPTNALSSGASPDLKCAFSSQSAPHLMMRTATSLQAAAAAA
jgi:hypothetical protein